MPAPIPDLDDRTFDQLAAEARALIPRYFPAWTDHNASDPGITLLEMFAHLFEASIYQINRVPDRTLRNFALLAGADAKLAVSAGPLELLRSAVEGMKSTSLRAVTSAEIEAAVIGHPVLEVARAKVFVEVRNRPNFYPAETITHVVTVPRSQALMAPPSRDQRVEAMTKEYRARVFRYLRPLCPITTRLNVSLAQQDPVSLSVIAVRDPRTRTDRAALQNEIEKKLIAYLDPLKVDANGKGWEFGRSVFRSELYQIIESTSGVEYVRGLTLKGSSQFGFGDLTDEIGLAAKLTGQRQGQDRSEQREKRTAYLRGQLSREQLATLRLANRNRPVTAELRKALTDSLNQLLETPNLWHSMIFDPPGPANVSQDEARKFNRKLIENAFPQELARIPEDADASRGELPLLTPFSVIKRLSVERDVGTLRVEVVDA